MRKKRRHHVARKSRVRPKSFNLVSGLIYAFAVIASITLGALFYRGYKNASPVRPHGERIVDEPIPEQPDPRESKPKQSATATSATPRPRQPEETRTAAWETGDRLMLPVQKRWTPPDLSGLPMRQKVLRPVADTAITLQPEARHSDNFGADTNLLIKGNDSVILARYNVSDLTGWTIEKAVFHAWIRRGRLHTLGFSTILADWDEGDGTHNAAATRGATFDWAGMSSARWTDKDEPAVHILRGNGFSRMHIASCGDTGLIEGEWISAPIDPSVIQALIAGTSYGLAISDEKGRLGTGAFLASREDKEFSHYIEIHGAPVDMTAPGMVTDLKARTHAELQSGIILTWTATGDDGDLGQAFKYDVRYAPVPATFDVAPAVPVYRTPHPQPAGERDGMVIEGLQPGVEYIFFVKTADETGLTGKAAETRFRVPEAAESLPEVSDPPTYQATPIDVAERSFGLTMIPETSGADPSGRGVASGLPSGSDSSTSFFWDRNSRTIHLRAALNETVAFQILLERRQDSQEPLAISVEPFSSARGDVNVSYALHRVWYALQVDGARAGAWCGDALIPLKNELRLTPDNRIQGQKIHPVFAELAIPENAQPGIYHSSLTIGGGSRSPSRINILLEVLPLTLPRRPQFAVELLAQPALHQLARKADCTFDETVDLERKYHLLAREHLCAFALQPSIGELPAPDFAPAPATAEGIGVISSWERWNKRFGGIFDGSALNGLPVSHFILPVFENWPVPFEEGYLCPDQEELRDGVPIYTGQPELIHRCLHDNYKEQFRSAIDQLVQHIDNVVVPHVCLSSEPAPGRRGSRPPWSLGKPVFHDDFIALEAFAMAGGFGSATGASRRAKFRVHVPDATTLGNRGVGVFDILAVGDERPASWELMRERTIRSGETLWLQKESLPIETSSAHVAATALRAFLNGAEGLSISETAGRAEHWIRANPDALIYPAVIPGLKAPTPSIRLKSIRRAQQDIEYLLLLQDKMGWNRARLCKFVEGEIPGLLEGKDVGSEHLIALRWKVQELLLK